MSAKYRIARIFPLQNHESLPAAQKEALKIDGKQIRIFREVLLQQCSFQEDKLGWWLEFFTHSNHPQRIFIEFTDCEDPYASSDECVNHKTIRQKWPISTLAYTQIPNLENENRNLTALKEACKATSFIVRGSHSISHQDLYEATTHFGHIDGRGSQFISTLKNNAQFKRHILLHSLAYAYLMTMEQLSDQLALMLSNKQSEEDLRNLYKDIALFNARYFFHQPVRLSNTASCETWQRIDKTLNIQATNNELIRQIENAHYIYDLEADKLLRKNSEEHAQREKTQARREKWRDRWLAIIGILVALASVPGLLELVV